MACGNVMMQRAGNLYKCPNGCERVCFSVVASPTFYYSILFGLLLTLTFTFVKLLKNIACVIVSVIC